MSCTIHKTANVGCSDHSHLLKGRPNFSKSVEEMIKIDKPNFSKLVEEMIKIGKYDDPLTLYFCHYQAEISEVFERSMPENNKWCNYKGPVIEFVGPMFHEAFRQTDVIDSYSGAADVVIWELLADERVSCFWQALNNIFKGKNYE